MFIKLLTMFTFGWWILDFFFFYSLYVLYIWFLNLFIIYLFIYRCIRSSSLRAGTTLCCSVWASHCGGFSCCRAQALGAPASIVVAGGLSSCGLQALEHRHVGSAACGIFPDQGSNPCPLHWQADS